MHPILGVRRRLSVYLLAWLVIGVLLAVGLRGERAWIAAAVFYLPLCAVFAFVTLSTWYLCRAFPMDARSKTWAVASVHLLAAGLALLKILSGKNWWSFCRIPADVKLKCIDHVQWLMKEWSPTHQLLPKYRNFYGSSDELEIGRAHV